MPRFYFHLASRGKYERDDVGSDLPNLHEAYLEAFEAAQEMSIDFIRQNARPARFRFEICDAADRVLMEVPFGEVLGAHAAAKEISDTAARGRALAQEVRNEIVKGQTQLITLWTALNRI